MTGPAIEELQRFGFKLFLADGATAAPREFVPVFHRWIQSQAIGEQLLIDVADYAHVPEGPGVMLVAHEGNFCVDLGGGRMGLAYNRKIPTPGRLPERLRTVARTLLQACRQLEGEAALSGRLRFRGDELQVFCNDRLLAPNHPETLARLQPSLDPLLRALYGDAKLTLTPEKDPRERFSLSVRAPANVSISDLFTRLGA